MSEQAINDQIESLEKTLGELKRKRKELDDEVASKSAKKKELEQELARSRLVEVGGKTLKKLIADLSNWRAIECDEYDLATGACQSDDCYCERHPERVGSIGLNTFTTFDGCFSDELRFCDVCLDNGALEWWFEQCGEDFHSQYDVWTIDPEALSASGRAILESASPLVSSDESDE